MTSPTRAPADAVLATTDESLLDLIDNLLNRGVVITGEVMLGLAGVDLVYLRLQAVLCAADRVQPRNGP
jgi:Gas vesicle protein